jgi:hypothetical protein
MPNNPAWRKVNWFAAFSGIGKQQTALGEFLADADIDTRDKCEMEINENVTRSEERSCDDVDVTGRPVRRRWVEIRLTYNQITPQILARFAAYKEGIAQPATGSPANEVQKLMRSDTVSGGAFPLSIELEGKTGSTKPISYNATPAQIQAALVNPAASIGRIFKIGDVTVSGDWTTGILITFSGRMAKANIPLLTVGNGVTGGGSVVPSQITQGDQNFFAIERSSDFSKPLFSLATGDKQKSVAVRKFGDASVNTIDINNGLEAENVTAVIVLTANYNPELSTSFTIPPCINPTALKSSDVKVEIDSVFESRDVVTNAVSLNDNVDANANFEADDVDFSVPTERGNRPTQIFTSELFGDESSNVYILAEQASVDTPNQETVPYAIHYGNPGNRFSVIADETFVSFQANRSGFAGPLDKRTTKITGEPWGVTGNPVHYAAMLNQSEAFLQT